MTRFADDQIHEACERIVSGGKRPVNEIRTITYYRLDSSIPEDPIFQFFQATDSELDDVIPVGWSAESDDAGMNAGLNKYFEVFRNDLLEACTALMQRLDRSGS